MTELWTLSARGLPGGIARKDFSCTEVVEAHLRRIRLSIRASTPL